MLHKPGLETTYGKRFISSPNVQNGFGIHPVSYSIGTGDTFADGRGTGV
jgi:hypothetical protein